jgi:transposase-like protein
MTSGTVLHGTRTALTIWFWTAYLMVTDKRGISASLIQRQFALRYETAWTILHKLRRAMVNSIREPLRGEIEMDEAWVGGYQHGLEGSRQLKGRKAALVLVAVESRGEGSGRLRMSVIPDFTGKTILRFAKQNILPGSIIFTDGMAAFRTLANEGYRLVWEKQVRMSEGGRPVVPKVDQAIGNLKQWLIGTHHGVGRPHLQAYLDEFVFRHNRRGNLGAAFQTLLGLGTGRGPTPYRTLIGAQDHNLLGIADSTG